MVRYGTVNNRMYMVGPSSSCTMQREITFKIITPYNQKIIEIIINLSYQGMFTVAATDAPPTTTVAQPVMLVPRGANHLPCATSWRSRRGWPWKQRHKLCLGLSRLDWGWEKARGSLFSIVQEVEDGWFLNHASNWWIATF
jgi:hypothetical protein